MDPVKLFNDIASAVPEQQMSVFGNLLTGALKAALPQSVSAPQKSNAEKVREFTSRDGLLTLPETPRVMTRAECDFLGRMICDELQEFARSVCRPDETPKDVVAKWLESSKPLDRVNYENDTEVIAEQVDALVDVYYYSLDACAKVGTNMSQVFDLVHEANMRKKFEDGTFHTLNDDPKEKIIKPPGWQEPNVKGLVNDWFERGTWTFELRLETE